VIESCAGHAACDQAAAAEQRGRCHSQGRRSTIAPSSASPKAITAMAHCLARLVYRMLKYGHQYVDKGMEHYDQMTNKSSRAKRRLPNSARANVAEVCEEFAAWTANLSLPWLD